MITINNKKIKEIVGIGNFFEEPLFENFTPETTKQLLWKNQYLTDNQSIPTLRVAPGLISSYYYQDSPLSLYFSETATYYNSNEISNVEELLNSDWYPTEEEYHTAKLALQMINKYRITKYNEYPHVNSEILSTSNGVLLVDQIVDEDSVLYGKSTEKTFNEMLMHAFDNYSKVYIKLHPETINNGKEGYLLKILTKNNLIDHPVFVIINENYNMASIFDYINEIFVVTSQVGFEALLRGKHVTCFGSPFYSGYGLTEDKQYSKKTQRNIFDLFVAIMIKYTNYLNPFNYEKGNILDLLEYISLQQRHINNNSFLLYKSKYNKKELMHLMQTSNIKKTNYISKKEAHSDCTILSDSKKHYALLKNHKKIALIQPGFLFNTNTTQKSLIIDFNGAFFSPNDFSDLEYTLKNEKFTDYEFQLADNFIEQLKQKYITEEQKKNAGNVFSLKKGNSNKKIIFVLGEEETTEIIKYGSAENIQTNYQLMLAVCKKSSNSVIIYKPFIIRTNDNEKDSFQMLERIAKENNNRIIIENESSISHCINAADEVHTINSIIGIEALIKNKKVVTYGFPFYGGWGLTEDVQFYERSRTNISLNNLILVAYMLYPKYLTPNSYLFTNAATAIQYNPKIDKGFYFNFKIYVKEINTIPVNIMKFFKTYF